MSLMIPVQCALRATIFFVYIQSQESGNRGKTLQIQVCNCKEIGANTVLISPAAGVTVDSHNSHDGYDKYKKGGRTGIQTSQQGSNMAMVQILAHNKNLQAKIAIKHL